MRAFGTLREHMREAVTGPEAAQVLAADGANAAASVAGGANDADVELGALNANVPAGTPTMNDLPTGDIAALARWMEDAMPVLLLLLAVFLYRHLLGIITFGWLTSILHNANERMRRQTLQKENRSRTALIVLYMLLLGHLGFIGALQGWDRLARQPSYKLVHQLELRRVADFDAEPPALSHLLWDVLMADLVARSASMLVKTQISFLCFFLLPNGGNASSARRLRRLFAFLESIGLCYRVLLPTPLWFHYLYHAAEGSPSDTSIWAFCVSHCYIAIKLVAFVDRLKSTASSARQAVCLRLPVGTYASHEEVLELGEEGCTICQEDFTAAVRLDCSHVFCEECITSWCERSTNPTCPLCRAAVPCALGAHSDGSTPLLPQVF